MKKVLHWIAFVIMLIIMSAICVAPLIGIVLYLAVVKPSDYLIDPIVDFVIIMALVFLQMNPLPKLWVKAVGYFGYKLDI